MMKVDYFLILAEVWLLTLAQIQHVARSYGFVQTVG